MRFIGVIPARFHSKRLPGKPLLRLAGRPLIEWVYRRAVESEKLAEVIVATDDERIQKAVRRFGGRVEMTSPVHASGTDRVAEVASRMSGDVFVNIQGDEPLMSRRTIDAVCRPFEQAQDLAVTTARIRITDGRQIESPHVNKVVVDCNGRALYFSRSVIPHPRNAPVRYFKHLGIYGYRRDSLLSLASLQPSELEQAEGLEQLRFLENGIPIYVVEVDEDSIGVDTREDLDRVIPLLQNEAPGRGRVKQRLKQGAYQGLEEEYGEG